MSSLLKYTKKFMSGELSKKEYKKDSMTLDLLDIFHVKKKSKLRKLVTKNEFAIYKMVYAHEVPHPKRKR